MSLGICLLFPQKIIVVDKDLVQSGVFHKFCLMILSYLSNFESSCGTLGKKESPEFTLSHFDHHSIGVCWVQ